MSPYQTLVIAGYGIITTIILVINGIILPLIFPRYFEEMNWTVQKEILQTLFVIFIIGLCNTFYTYWLGMFSLTIQTFVSFILYALLVALIPVTLVVLIEQIRLLKNNLAEAKQLSNKIDHKHQIAFEDQDKIVELIAENEKDRFLATTKNLLYFAAADNYIEIFYLDRGEIKKTLLRTTLKRTQEQLKEHSVFYRCHRAFLVNLSQVKSVTGNAQGFRLILENTTEQIPVSRNLNSELASKLTLF